MHRGRAACVGAVAGALATLPGLGTGTLWDNSETAYGEVAREILLTHDWVVMHFNGVPWFTQPPLYFWVAALCAKMLGLGGFALRLPSAVATVAMGAAIAYAVATWAGERAGIFTSIVLSTALMQAVIGRLAIMDALLDLFVMVAVFAWFEALRSGETRAYVLGSVALGLGFLTKGPVAPVVALLVIVPYYYWSGGAKTLRLPSPGAATASVAAFAAIAAPWLALLATRTGAGSIAELIGHYTFGRYTSVIENQSGPVWYYVPVLVLGFFPWIAFVAPAVTLGASRVRDNALWRLGIVWSVTPLLFFSFAQTKLPNYVALEIPGLAIVTGLYFDAVASKGATRSALIAAAVVPVTIALLAVAIRIFTLDNRLTTEVHAAVPALSGAALAIFFGSLVTAVLLWKNISIAPYALAGAMLAALDVLAVAVLPHAEAFKPIPRLAAVIDRERIPGDIVAIENVSGSNALLFYTRPPIVIVHTERRLICSSPRLWLVEPRTQRPLDPRGGGTRSPEAIAAGVALYLYSGDATCSRSPALR